MPRRTVAAGQHLEPGGVEEVHLVQVNDQRAAAARSAWLLPGAQVEVILRDDT